MFRNYRKDGAPFWQEHNVSPVRDEAGRITHHVGIINHITERKALEDELVHRAFHDGLTAANETANPSSITGALESAAPSTAPARTAISGPPSSASAVSGSR